MHRKTFSLPALISACVVHVQTISVESLLIHHLLMLPLYVSKCAHFLFYFIFPPFTTYPSHHSDFCYTHLVHVLFLDRPTFYFIGRNCGWQTGRVGRKQVRLTLGVNRLQLYPNPTCFQNGSSALEPHPLRVNQTLPT